MRFESYIDRYGKVASLFVGDKASMYRALNVRTVEMIVRVGYGGQLPSCPENGTLLMELGLASERDFDNFGRFYYTIVECNEVNGHEHYATRRYWLNDISSWQLRVLRDPEMQHYLSFRNSLEMLGTNKGLPVWVIQKAGGDYRGNSTVSLPPGWSHTNSPMRLITPGATQGGEPKKGRQRTPLLSKHRTYPFLRSKKQRSATSGSSVSTSGHGGKRRSPPPPSCQRHYCAEVQSWSSFPIPRGRGGISVSNPRRRTSLPKRSFLPLAAPKEEEADVLVLTDDDDDEDAPPEAVLHFKMYMSKCVISNCKCSCEGLIEGYFNLRAISAPPAWV
ncbi:hypothetical protein VKT23_010719 [Stygiomarasmius scandens]|uniref:Uncharacterized protein n=1 Tax=Marasmiellus scandens TaxID=2682957 RepID=A0ABR1JGA2_9AGAR